MADIKQIGTYHLADNPKLYEPARTNNFEFIVVGLDRLLKAGVDAETAGENDYLTNAQDVIRFSISETSVPHFALNVIEVKRGNTTMKFAGTPSFDAGTLKFNDYMGAQTKDYILAWKALAYDVRTEKIQLASNYKIDCYLKEYTPDYSRVLRTWEMKGCWVSDCSEDSFSSDSDDKRQVTVTLQYDRAIPVYDDEN